MLRWHVFGQISSEFRRISQIYLKFAAPRPRKILEALTWRSVFYICCVYYNHNFLTLSTAWFFILFLIAWQWADSILAIGRYVDQQSADILTDTQLICQPTPRQHINQHRPTCMLADTWLGTLCLFGRLLLLTFFFSTQIMSNLL